MDQIYVDSSERKITIKGFNSSSAKMLPIGTVLFTSRAGIGKTAILNKEACTNQGFQSIVPHKDELDSYFIFSRTAELKKYGETVGAGSTFVEVSGKQMAEMKLSIPSLAEQQKIGQFFCTLDNLIKAVNTKLCSLQGTKKYFLQKMFPKQGETVPQIRFKGFSDEWQEKKLGEIGVAISGIGFPEKEQGGKEGIPFFKVSDMNLSGNENEMQSANNYVTVEQIKLKKWKVMTEVPAIFFAKVGAAVLLNRKRLCRTPFLFDNNTMAYTLNKDVWNADFAKAEFERIDLTALVQVGALPSYNASDVENITINIPSLAEQQKIGQFFKTLDDSISCQKQKLDQLKTLKKAMLQKMFC